MEYKDPGRYIPIIYLLYSWGSLFGVPSRVPLVIVVFTSIQGQASPCPLLPVHASASHGGYVGII